METARHGSELRGLADVDRSSLANGRFGRLFAGCDPAKHSERVLNELAKTMIQGEFQTRGMKGRRSWTIRCMSLRRKMKTAQFLPVTRISGSSSTTTLLF